jgi:hypothetical protein
MRHHLLFLGGPCFTTTAPGERWSCRGEMSACSGRLWRMPAVSVNSSAGLLACPMKWLLHFELPQQHWVDYEPI